MRKWLFGISGIVVILILGTSWTSAQRRPTVNPDLTSGGPLAFGPEDTLFMADNMAATIFALRLDSEEFGRREGTASVRGLDQKIAAMLGTVAEEILINDIAVSPNSKNTFLSVSRSSADTSAPVLLRVDGTGTIDVIELDQIAYTRVELPNPADNFVQPGRPGPRPPYLGAQNRRMETVTDMAYLDGQLLVSGLSNEEFASKLRSVAYPFSGAGTGSSVEIWHASHGAFETRAPVYTFVPHVVDGEQNLIAGYFCTPLVRFSTAALAAGNAFTGKVRGTTIAEMGAYNRPLDMIVYEQNGEDILLITTVSKGVMKMTMDDVADQEPIAEKVPEMEDISGVPFEAIDRMEGTVQLAMLDETQAVIAIRDGDGLTHLNVIALP
jgi:hypothetical protein